MLPGCYFSKKEYVRKLCVYTCSKKKNTGGWWSPEVLRTEVIQARGWEASEVIYRAIKNWRKKEVWSLRSRRLCSPWTPLWASLIKLKQAGKKEEEGRRGKKDAQCLTDTWEGLISGVSFDVKQWWWICIPLVAVAVAVVSAASTPWALSTLRCAVCLRGRIISPANKVCVYAIGISDQIKRKQEKRKRNKKRTPNTHWTDRGTLIIPGSPRWRRTSRK